jgi:hypothetical protein
MSFSREMMSLHRLGEGRIADQELRSREES